jgi:hypothetical protein
MKRAQNVKSFLLSDMDGQTFHHIFQTGAIFAGQISLSLHLAVG